MQGIVGLMGPDALTGNDRQMPLNGNRPGGGRAHAQDDEYLPQYVGERVFR